MLFPFFSKLVRRAARRQARSLIVAPIAGLLSLLVFASVWGAPSIALSADSLKARGKQHQKKASELCDFGRWDEAVAEYEIAYALLQEPQILLEMAQALERKGDMGRAIDVGESLLSKASPGPLHEEAEKLVKALRVRGAPSQTAAESVAHAPLQLASAPEAPDASVPPDAGPAYVDPSVASAQNTLQGTRASAGSPDGLAPPAPTDQRPGPYPGAASAPFPAAVWATAWPPPVAPPVPSAAPDPLLEMDWFVPALRLGVGHLSLSADKAGFMADRRTRCSDQGMVAGPYFAPPAGSQRCDLGIDEPLNIVGVGLHLGGDYYFVRLDSWYAWNNAVRMYGMGFYPLSFGWFIPSVGLFPYASGGVAVETLNWKITNEKGVLFKTRLSLGLKKRVLNRLGLGAEAAYSGNVIGAAAQTEAASLRGGTGNSWDIALSIEWF